MNPLDRLSVAALAFFLLHAVVSGTKLRDALVRALGEKVYRAAFSLASFASLGFLILAFRGSPCAPLWILPRVFDWLPLAVMPFALCLMVGAYSVTNPTALGGERALSQSEPARGALRITRHPFLWGVMLWSAAHLAVIGGTAALWFFGSFWLTAALGTLHIDRKRAAKGSEAWERYERVTSNLPFGAIAAGRNRLVLCELRVPVLGALGLTLGLLFTHQWLFGVSPIPH